MASISEQALQPFGGEYRLLLGEYGRSFLTALAPYRGPDPNKWNYTAMGPVAATLAKVNVGKSDHVKSQAIDALGKINPSDLYYMIREYGYDDMATSNVSADILFGAYKLNQHQVDFAAFSALLQAFGIQRVSDLVLLTRHSGTFIDEQNPEGSYDRADHAFTMATLRYDDLKFGELCQVVGVTTALRNQQEMGWRNRNNGNSMGGELTIYSHLTTGVATMLMNGLGVNAVEDMQTGQMMQTTSFGQFNWQLENGLYRLRYATPFEDVEPSLPYFVRGCQIVDPE